MRARKRSNTLFQLLVIAGVIAGIVITAMVIKFTGGSIQATVHSTESTIQTLKMAVSAYKMDTGKFPESLSQLVAGEKRYVEAPTVPTDAWGRQFRYYVKDDVAIIRSAGIDGVIDTDDDIEND